MMVEECLEELTTSGRVMEHQYILLSHYIRNEMSCAELSPEAAPTYSDASHD